jgi:uncharacterized protein YcfJ
MKKIAATLVAAIFVSGCANTGAMYQPLVDLKSSTGSNYAQDLQECQAYAATQMSAGGGAVAGAVAGAVFGLLVNAALGGGMRNSAASLGALSGASSAAAGAETNQRDVIRRCMAGRGWTVLS